MSKPTILAVDDDPEVSAAITRDLRGRYGADYRIVRATSGPRRSRCCAGLALRDQPVALIVADQRMPRDDRHRDARAGAALTPRARSCLLLTAYADTDVAIKAINDIGLDYYLLKPWDPPEERLYPVIDDLLDDWRQANPDHTSDVRVVGHRWSDRSHEIKTFLARNHVPYRWYDVERDAEAQRLRDLAQATLADLPLVLVPDGETLRAPSTLELADALGLRTSGRAAALRRVHRRRRAGRAGRRGVRRVGGAEHRHRRARGARRPGRPERGDRELPGLPEGADRRRPHPARRRPGVPVRRRDGARPRRRRLRGRGPGARRAASTGRGRSRRAR